MENIFKHISSTFWIHVQIIVQSRRSLCNIMCRISARFSQEINSQYLPRDYPTFLHAARRKVDRVWRQGSRKSDTRRSRERILQAHCQHITSEKYINVETARYCRLGEPAKTLDTDLRMSIVLSSDVLTGGRLPAFKLHVYWDSRKRLWVQ